MKTCSRCKTEKALDAFSPRKDAPDGRAYRCKTCQAEVVKVAYVPTERSRRRKSDWKTRTKVCSVCNERKSFDEYSKRSGRKDYQSYCKKCDAHYQRQYRFGLTKQAFETIWDDQGGCCAACRRPIQRGTGKHAVDHCHTTGVVRGILCASCNLALGHLQDDPERIRNLLSYLEQHG